MQPSWHVDDRTPVEITRHGFGIERRRHHDEAEIVSRAPRLSRERNREIGMNAALVKLVEHDCAKVREEGIALHPRGQDAFGDDEQPRIVRETVIETDLPADLTAERPAALGRDPGGDRPRGQTPRLKQDDGAVGRERRRHARGLARARRGGDDDRSRPPQIVDDAIDERVDRARAESAARARLSTGVYRLATDTPTGQDTPVPPRPQ